MQIQEDKGNDDYELPEVADYAYCTRVVIQNEEYYLQIGCADGNSLSIAVNIYSDNTCTTRSVVDGYDDSNIDISEIQVSSYGKSYLYTSEVFKVFVSPSNNNTHAMYCMCSHLLYAYLFILNRHSFRLSIANRASCGLIKMTTRSMICFMKIAKQTPPYALLPGVTSKHAVESV